MKVLLIGSGGREHALAWKIAQSPRLEKLYIAPGNAGTAEAGENVVLDINDHAQIIEFARSHGVKFVVIGPDAQVVAGLSDDVQSAGMTCFGPSKAAAQLEGSKSFTKALCDEMHIPTAAYGFFEALEPALAYVRGKSLPIVIKADGLAAGKGVVIANTAAEAESAIASCFEGAFGAAGASVVIEEFMDGEEASLFVLCDGEHTLLLESAQDHKRAFDGDKGPNTGGMGAYSPAPVMTDALLDRAMREIVAPTVAGLAARGTPYRGVLYVGLMLTTDGPKLVEYNARFGDPETQVLMLRLETDILDLLEATAAGSLKGATCRWKEDAALTVIMATKGYPGGYGKGSVIRGAEALNSDTIKVFHAGTIRDGETLCANGGRVLNVTALGQTIAEARDNAYAAVEKIDWPEGFYRRDIGWRALGQR